MYYIVLVVFCAQFFIANAILFSEEIENSEWHKFKVKFNLAII